jgi:nitrous oxide reductase accessory protein NosL
MFKIVISLVSLVVFLFATSSLPPKAPTNYKMDWTKETISQIRKIKISKNPKFVAKISSNNGKKLFFISPKSFFEFYFRPQKWESVGIKDKKEFKELIITDYSTLKPVDAKTSFYVYGSSITTPAGDDLISFENKQKAVKFAKRYNGKRVLSFYEVSDALIKLLNGRI